jgi:hypothetical protein
MWNEDFMLASMHGQSIKRPEVTKKAYEFHLHFCKISLIEIVFWSRFPSLASSLPRNNASFSTVYYIYDEAWYILPPPNFDQISCSCNTTISSFFVERKEKKNVLLEEKHFHTCNSSDVFVLDFHGQASWGHEATGWHKAKIWGKNGFIFPLSTYSGDTFGA